MISLYRRIILIGCLSVFFYYPAHSQLSGSYTINPSINQARNYRSVASAIEALEKTGVSGPVDFSIASGKYHERLIISKIVGASKKNTITFKGANQDSVLLFSQESSSFSESHVVWLKGSDYVHFQNMTIEKSGGSFRSAIRFSENADSNHFRNVTFRVLGQSTNNRVVVFAGNKGWNDGGTNGNYNVFDSCQLQGGYSAVDLMGSKMSGNTQNQFVNCQMTGCYRGVYNIENIGTQLIKTEIQSQIQAFDDFKCSGTELKECKISSQTGKSVFVGNYSGQSLPRNLVLFRNEITGTEIVQNSVLLNGFESVTDLDSIFGNTMKAASSSNLSASFMQGPAVLSNNFILGGFPDSMDYEVNIKLYLCEDWKIYHNTVFNNGGGKSKTGSNPTGKNQPGNLLVERCSKLFFENNLFDYAGAHTWGANVINVQSNWLKVENNNYETTAKVYAESTSVLTDLAGWKLLDKNFNRFSTNDVITYVDRANLDFHLIDTIKVRNGSNVGYRIDGDGDSRCRFDQTIGADQSRFPATKPIASFSIPDTVYVNNPTLLINNNAADNSVEHRWYVNGVYRSFEGNYTFTFKFRTSYDIALVAVGCAGRDSIFKTVFADTTSLAPIANFVANKAVYDLQEEVFFSDISVNSPTKWRWLIKPDSVFDPLLLSKEATYLFTKGTSLNSQYPSMEFQYPGTYTVSIAVKNNKGKDSITIKDVITVRASNSICIYPDESTVSEGTIYDDGGSLPYGNNVDCSFLIHPCASQVNLEFKVFDLVAGDYLKIYDGTDNTGIPLWNTAIFGTNGLTGNIKGTGFVTNLIAKTGAMYLEFKTNANGTSTGFMARWSSKVGAFQVPVSSFESVDSVCTGQPLVFKSTATGDISEHIWRFGVSAYSTSNEINPEYVYSIPGKYKVTYITDGCGGRDSSTKYIYVYTQTKAPKGSFYADVPHPAVGDVVKLIPVVANCVDAYKWLVTPTDYSFVGGTSANSEFPLISFTKPGCYDVILEITNAKTKTSISQTCAVKVIEYCKPSIENLSEDLGISIVSINGSPFLESRTTSGKAGYTDYSGQTSLHTRIERGAEHTIEITRPSNHNKVQRAVWIDWNQDGKFDSKTELIITDKAGSGSLSLKGKFKVPYSALKGGTRMRVASNLANRGIDACGPLIYGEYEDYRVYVSDDETLPEITLNGTSSILINQCASYTELGAIACDNIGGCGYPVVISGTIDITTAGDYFIQYNAKDSLGNAAETVTRKVTVLPDNDFPLISLSGADTVDISLGDPYVEPGYSTFDSCGIASQESISNINVQEPGSYIIVYKAIDKAKNETKVYRVVNIKDNLAPVITLNGPSTLTQEVGSEYIDSGVTALDNYYSPGALFLMVDGNVDVHQLGSYTLSYRVIDPAGNISNTVTRQIDVVDNTAPVVVLVGSDSVFVEGGKRFSDPMASATDNYSVGLTGPFKSGDFYKEFPNSIPTTLGIYEAVYTFIDGSGNSASISRYIIVEDNTAPQLTLLGDFAINLCKWQAFTDPGYVVLDNIDLNPTVNVRSDLNTGIPGIYKITYQAVDESNQSSEELTRVITVKNCLSSTSEFVSDHLLKVYPNPSHGSFIVELEQTLIGNLNIEIVDAMGHLIEKQAFVKNQALYFFDLESTSAGLYFIKLTSDQMLDILPVVIVK